MAALWRARQAAQAKGESEASTKQPGWMEKLLANILEHLKVIWGFGVVVVLVALQPALAPCGQLFS